MLPRITIGLIALLIGCASTPPTLVGSDSEFAISGDVRSPEIWDADRIRATFPDDVRVEEFERKGQTFRNLAIPLARLIEHAGPQLMDAPKNHALAFAVVLEATDGYTVAYTLEEIIPYQAEPTILLAFADESGPLPHSIAPARLIDPGSPRGSRALHAIREIRVVDLARH